ncbi:hypothetical protein [Xylella fastidiosa]|uniref:hypothetical protein n=1 Tax=Xylella fastidiosa TaxID=2371 RepID=UPI0039852D31
MAQVRAKGGEIRKVKWGGRHGAPDRIAMLPEGRTLWVELKAPGQQCTPHQVREHAHAPHGPARGRGRFL